MITIPFSAQNCCSSNDGRQGCTSTWFVTGTTAHRASNSVSVLTEKLDTPIDLTFPLGGAVHQWTRRYGGRRVPVSSSCSICFQVSTTVGYWPHGICSPDVRGVSGRSCAIRYDTPSSVSDWGQWMR